MAKALLRQGYVIGSGTHARFLLVNMEGLIEAELREAGAVLVAFGCWLSQPLWHHGYACKDPGIGCRCPRRTYNDAVIASRVSAQAWEAIKSAT